jgi:hypothetical protein
MQDALSKVLINLASGNLLTVLVLYLVLHQGFVCGHSRLYSSRRCENKGQDTRYWENYGRRGCTNFYMKRLCKLHYIPVQGSCLVPNRGQYKLRSRFQMLFYFAISTQSQLLLFHPCFYNFSLCLPI